ncbi:MAG: CRISPR-associated helicase Cas3', partial [Chloroflexota bacterium]|nr:CRISPR-associated helicase Cas3' [Chloroflexota bacterium]
EACSKSAMDRIVRPGVYSLTLPTGSGKTYTGLRIAADLAQRLSLSSLIYVLPFISIVDQTASFARQCFNPDEIQEDHSLRPIQFEDGYHPLQHMRAMFRYWHQPVIITTLAQFWEAVFSAPANRTMNFHRLANAVILLDEPQSLAPKYWQGLGELLEYLSDRLGSVFILMTATQPQITQYAGSGGELAPSVYHFPEIRHHYRIDGVDERQTLDDLMALIEDEGLLHDRPAGMVVLNTKKCALAVYDRIHTVADSTLKDHVLFLSAWLTPYRREKLLRRLRELEEQDSPRILVATQVVEAGVDLDFDWVIRDMGPFDSIVQVAGRCNRHQKRAHQGRVYVLNLEDEQTGRSFASYIYDTILLEATREVLRGRTRFDERDVPELIRRYYNAITDRLTPSDIVRQLRVGAWDQPFPLYPEKDVLQMQLIVEETDEVAGLVNKLENTHWRLATLTQKKALMQKLRQHMIDIPAKYRSSMALVCAQIASNEPLLQDINNGKMVMMSEHLIFNQAGPEGQSYLYHPIKGFIPPDEESLARPLTF